MKFYVIAMMVFLLSISVALIQQIDVMNYNQAYQKDWIDYAASDSFKDQGYDNPPFDSNSGNDGNMFTDYRVGATIFLKALYYATVGLAEMLKNFGAPGVLAVLFALPIWMVYFVFIVQVLLLKFGFEGTR